MYSPRLTVRPALHRALAIAVAGAVLGGSTTLALTANTPAHAADTRPAATTPAAVPTIGGTAPNGVIGQSYTYTPTSTHEPGTVFTVTGGALPDGLTLDPETGAISGYPNLDGDYSFTISVTDTGGTTEASFTITIPTPTISGTAPDAIVGQPYTFTPTTTNFTTGPVAEFVMHRSSLPNGLTFDPATGTITGVPTAAGDWGFPILLYSGHRKFSAWTAILINVKAPVPSEEVAAWDPLHSYTIGDRVQHNGRTYECIQTHQSWGDPNWINAPSLWRNIN